MVVSDTSSRATYPDLLNHLRRESRRIITERRLRELCAQVVVERLLNDGTSTITQGLTTPTTLPIPAPATIPTQEIKTLPYLSQEASTTAEGTPSASTVPPTVILNIGTLVLQGAVLHLVDPTVVIDNVSPRVHLTQTVVSPEVTCPKVVNHITVPPSSPVDLKGIRVIAERPPGARGTRERRIVIETPNGTYTGILEAATEEVDIPTVVDDKA